MTLATPTMMLPTPMSPTTAPITKHLIVWSGDDDSGTLVNNELEIWGQRVNAALGGLGTNDFRISDMGGSGDAVFDAY